MSNLIVVMVPIDVTFTIDTEDMFANTLPATAEDMRDQVCQYLDNEFNNREAFDWANGMVDVSALEQVDVLVTDDHYSEIDYPERKS